MGEQRPIMRPSDMRRTVSEWAAQGFSVAIEPDGRIVVKPAPPPGDKVDALTWWISGGETQPAGACL